MLISIYCTVLLCTVWQTVLSYTSPTLFILLWHKVRAKIILKHLYKKIRENKIEKNKNNKNVYCVDAKQIFPINISSYTSYKYFQLYFLHSAIAFYKTLMKCRLQYGGLYGLLRDLCIILKRTLCEKRRGLSHTVTLAGHVMGIPSSWDLYSISLFINMFFPMSRPALWSLHNIPIFTSRDELWQTKVLKQNYLGVTFHSKCTQMLNVYIIKCMIIIHWGNW